MHCAVLPLVDLIFFVKYCKKKEEKYRCLKLTQMKEEGYFISLDIFYAVQCKFNNVLN